MCCRDCPSRGQGLSEGQISRRPSHSFILSSVNATPGEVGESHGIPLSLRMVTDPLKTI